jgi:hypothetical protein
MPPAAAALLVLGLLPALAPADAFSRLGALAGEWEAKTEKGAAIRVSYRAISNGSALVQSFITPSGKETMTVFHPDGASVVATHYCAQGNQPRLRLDPGSTAERLIFVFADATNLPDKAQSHMTRLELLLEGPLLDGPTQYTEIETYEAAGQQEVTTLRFRRLR